jgi:hypothetical protein
MMAEYVVTARVAARLVRFLYREPEKALRKAQKLRRDGRLVSLTADRGPITIEELELRAMKPSDEKMAQTD